MCLQKSIKGLKDKLVCAGVEQYERAAEPGGEPVQWGDWGGPGAASTQLPCLHQSQPQLPPSHRRSHGHAGQGVAPRYTLWFLCNCSSLQLSSRFIVCLGVTCFLRVDKIAHVAWLMS